MDRLTKYSLGAVMGVKRGTGKVRDAAGRSSEAAYMLEVQRDENGEHAVSGLLLTVAEPEGLAFDGPVVVTLATGEELEASLRPVDGIQGPPFAVEISKVPPGVFPHF